MGKAPNEAKDRGPAPNEAIGKLGKTPNEANLQSARAERSQFAPSGGFPERSQW
jgi:hypothetical protein